MDLVARVRHAVAAHQRSRPDLPVVVALDGRSGAGKSTLAEAIARDLGASVVHGDDFYRDMPDAERRSLSAADGVDRFFDWERLRDEALVPLRARTPARYRCFNWAAGHGLGETIVIEPRDVVIVEGVYAARPELKDLVDLRVLMVVNESERERRLDQRAGSMDRHAPEALDDRWDASERVYFEMICPTGSFDLVITGDK